MGGIGSGARRSINTGNVEDMLALDIRVLRRLGLIRPGECMIDMAHWSIGGLSTPSGLLRVDLNDIEHGGVLTITGDMPDGTIRQHIDIEAKPTTFGGYRCYFVCPITTNRCEILYYFNGRFSSRKGQRLTYEVQGMTDLSRVRRKVAKLRARMAGTIGFRCPHSQRHTKILCKLMNAESTARELYMERLHIHAKRNNNPQ